MIWRHKLFLFTMSFVVLVTNIGLNVFTHWCKEDGAFVSYIVPINDHCDEEKEIIALPSCCQKEIQSSCSVLASIEKQDCCSDDFDWIKLSVDQDNSTIEKAKFKNETHQVVSLTHRLQINRSKKVDHVVYSNADPPPSPNGKDILILHQVFRI